jgi:addiction module HigA family antidote
MKNPTHPGEILREDVLPALGLTVNQAAEKLGIDSRALSAVLEGRASITPEIAERIECWLGVENGGRAEVWLSLQSKYDRQQANLGGNDADWLAAAEKARAEGFVGTGEPMPVRMRLALSPELNSRLEQLASENRTTKSEILRKAMALFDVATEAKKKGMKIGIVDEGNNLVTEITGI